MPKIIKSSSGTSSGGNKATLTFAPTSSNNKQLPNISTKTIKNPSNSVSAGAKVDKTRSIDNFANVIKLGNNYNLGNGSIGTIGKTRNVGKNIIGKTTYNAETDKEASIYTIQRDSKYITSDYLNRLNAYFDSGAQNATDSRTFRNEAVAQRNQAYDPEEKAWWDNAIKYLDTTVYNNYKGRIDRINASLEGYNTNLTNATNEFRSTQDLLGYQTDSNSAEYKDLFGRNQTASSKMKTAQGQVDRANAMKTQLEDEMAGYFMDRDTFEARERLEKNNYVGTERDLNLYATDPSALTNERSKKEMDQARLDAYNRSLGINEKFYNHEDKWKANTEATISDINSGIIGAFSDFNKIGYEFAKGVDRESFAVNPPKEKAQPVSAEQAVREKASITNRIAILEKQEADIKRSAGTDSLHLNDEAYSSVAAIDKELRGLKKKLTEYNDIINASGDGPTSLGYTLKNFSEDDFFGFLDRAQDNLDAQTALKLNKAMQDTGAVEKFGMNLSRTMAEVGFDWAVSYITGMPALASMYARVEGKASAEGRRVLAAREARGENVNTEILGINLSAQDKASIYGHASAGVEILTEKLTDGLGYIYGRGKATDIVEKAISMLADTPDGMNFLRFIADSSGEGGEEVISDLIDPALKCIINGESLKHNYSELEASELLYDYFLGWVMGLSGATSGLVSDGPEGYAAKNVDIYQNKVDSDIQARQDILQEGLNQFNAVTPPQGSLAQQVIDATRDSGENSQTRQQRIVQMLQDPEQVKLFEQATGKEITGNTIAEKWASVESILSGRTKGETIREETQTKLEEREKKDAPITKAIQKYQQGEDLNRSEISMLYAAGVIDKSQRDAMRQLEKADRLIAKSAAKTNQRREFFIQQAQDNGVRTRAEKNNAPVFEGEARLANDEIEHNQANPPESAVMAPQSVPTSGGTDIATTPAESVKPTAEPLTRDESRKAIENHEADNKKLASVVPIVDAAVSAEKPVHQINGNLFAKTGQEGEPPLSKKVWNWLQQFFVKGEGPNIYSNKLKADVIINERGLKNDVSHHLGETKAATFEAIPYVIRNGMTVSKTTDGNGKVRSIIVAGKVYLNNKNGKNGIPVNVYCLLKADDSGQNRFYLHEVSDGKGNLYYQLSNAEKDASTALQDSTPQKQGSAEETSSAQSVPQAEAESKPAQQSESKSLPPIESRSAELTDLINRLSYSGADEIGPLVSLAKSDFDSLSKAYNELTGMELPKTGYESALRQLAVDYSGLAVDEAAGSMMANNEPLPVQQENGTIEAQERSVENGTTETPSIRQNGRDRGVPQQSGEDERAGRAHRKTPARTPRGSFGIKTFTRKGVNRIKGALKQQGLAISNLVKDTDRPSSFNDIENWGGGSLHFAVDKNGTSKITGAADIKTGKDSYGSIIFLGKDNLDTAGNDAVHEISHRHIREWETKNNRRYYCDDQVFAPLINNKAMSLKEATTLRGLAMQEWAYNYLAKKLTQEQLNKAASFKNPEDAINYFAGVLDKKDFDLFDYFVNEEVVNELASRNYSLFENRIDKKRLWKITNEIRRKLVYDDVFVHGAFNNIDHIIDRVNRDAKQVFDSFVEPVPEKQNLLQRIWGKVKPVKEFDPTKEYALYHVKSGREKKLIAVRNVSERTAWRLLKSGGEAMPSIAVTKANHGHEFSGEITLVYNASTIDPAANPDNKVYGADAWTPSFPSGISESDTDINKDNAKEMGNYLYSLVTSIAPIYYHNSWYNRDYYVPGYYGETSDGFLDGEYRQFAGFKVAMAAEKGIPVDFFEKEKGTKSGVSSDILRVLKDWIKAGPDIILDKKFFQHPEFEDIEEYLSKNKSAYNNIREDFKEAINFSNIKDGPSVIDSFTDADINNVISDIMNDASFDQLQTDIDIDSKISDEEVTDWLRDKLKQFDVVNKGSANERALSKMLQEPERRISGHDARGLLPVLATSFKNVDDIISEENRLNETAGNYDYDTDLSEDEELGDIALSISNNGGTGLSTVNRFIEAAAEAGGTVGDIIDAAESFDIDLTDEEIEKLSDVFRRIAALPTGYFEAKPRRIVPNSEIAGAIIPNSRYYDDLSSAFEKEGMKTFRYREEEYDYDDEPVDFAMLMAGEEPERRKPGNSGKTRSQIMAEDLSEYLFHPKRNGADPLPSGTVIEHSEGELKKKTQVKGAKAEHEERMADIAKKFGTDDGTFLSYTREEVSRIANYCIEKYGMQEEWNRLMGEKNWSRVDFSEAGKIVYEMTIQLNRDMTNGNSGLGPILERKPGESNKEYFERQKQSDKDAYLARREPIDAMLQMYAQQKSEAGQKLQEQHKFTIADEIRMRASQRFLSYTEDGEVNNASDLAKNAKMWNIIDDLLTRAEKADTSGSKDAMMDVTKLVSRIRGRETMWGRLGTKEESRMLKDLYNGGFDSDAMASLMYGGISKIIDDLTPMTYADVIQTVRMNNMLSSPATALNNFLNNANALRVGSIAQNAAYPFAKVFEALTGKKVAFTDTSFTRIGKGKMRAEKMAMEYALLSAYYGMDGERGRFDPKDSNTGFWLNGSGASGVAGRALARYNFLINAMVLSPDAPAKARANLGMKEGIERAFAGEEMTPEKARNKKELEAFADVETKRRALQDDNGATRAVLWAKNQINKAHTPGGKTVVKGRQLGELRLGDFAIAFAKVPANVGLQKVMATPYGAAFQMGRYAAGLIEAAHNPEGMDTIKMAKLSRDIGRAFTTWGMIGLGALGAMTGALKNFDDTDDDEEKKLAAEKGYNGLTFNVSALLRRGSEWKDGDLVVSGNFLEILALPLTIGAFMYDAQQEGMGTFKAIDYGTKESFAHLVDAVMEIPGLQQVGQLWESYAANKNTDASDYERAMKSLGQFVANSSTSYLIPNLVAQTAAGLDNKHRDIYNTTAYGESLKNIWMAKIPGLREKLPEKTDTFGNTRTYGDNSIMAMVNTVLLPGDIKKYHVSELEKELLRLKKETGYNGTLFDTKAQRKIETGNGEIEYTLNPDQQRAFHMAKAKYLVEAFDKFRTSDEYKNLTDDQRLDVLKMLRMDAERMVKNECLEEAGVEDRIRIDKWEETLTNWDDKIQYLSAKQLASSLWDDENNAVANFEGMDKFMQGDYKKLTPEMKELITNSLGYLDDIEAASKYKLTSEQWQTGHDIYRYYVDKIDASKTDDEKVTLAQESQMWADIQKATGATDHQMEYFEGDMKLWFQNTPNANQYYEYLKDAGMTRQEAANTIKTISDLKPQPGYEESGYIQASQRYIAICDTVPKDKQWAAFWTIVPSNAAKKKVAMMHDLQAQGVSLRTALSASGMGEIRGRTEIAPGKWKYYTISK